MFGVFMCLCLTVCVWVFGLCLRCVYSHAGVVFAFLCLRLSKVATKGPPLRPRGGRQGEGLRPAAELGGALVRGARRPLLLEQGAPGLSLRLLPRARAGREGEEGELG